MESILSADDLFNSRILIIDDEPDNLSLVKDALIEKNFRRIQAMSDPDEALTLFPATAPEIVIVNWHVGEGVLASLIEVMRDRRLPLILLMSEANWQQRSMALSAGATDVLKKPVDAAEISRRICNLLEVRHAYLQLSRQDQLLQQRLEEDNRRLSGAFEEVLLRLARTVEQRNSGDSGHLTRMATLTCRIGRVMGMPEEELETLYRAAQLHDVGNAMVRDRILGKAGRLDEDERHSMQNHTIEGARMLQPAGGGMASMAGSIALTHHERWDGTGYPYGLRGSAIPKVSRIAAVGDVFDALVHRRPHRPAWDLKPAVKEIKLQAGLQFDPQVVDAFSSVVSEDPGLESLGYAPGKYSALS